MKVGRDLRRYLRMTYAHNYTDIDECNNTSICDVNALCINTYGNFTCSCKPQYSGDGFSCDGQYSIIYEIVIVSVSQLDINECDDATMNNCDPINGNCNNTDGGFTCSCNPGYTGDGVNCSSKSHE